MVQSFFNSNAYKGVTKERRDPYQTPAQVAQTSRIKASWSHLVEQLNLSMQQVTQNVACVQMVADWEQVN
jgi:hypothetical protein